MESKSRADARWSRVRRARGAAWLPAALAAVALLAGCGGDSSGGEDGVASGGASAPDSDQALRFAQCMRDNGVPGFPDPVEGGIRITPDSGVDFNSPEFQAAREACQDEAPEGLGGGSAPDSEVEEQVLAFAQCMRDNGIDFPDPDFSGGAVRMPGPEGVDFDSPEFHSAQEQCSEHLQGLGGMRRGGP